MSIRELLLLSGNAPFKRVKSISLGLGRQAYAILINSHLACSTEDFLACAIFRVKNERRRSEIIFRGNRKGGNPRLERASTLCKYACEIIRLACHAVHRSRASWGKRYVYACYAKQSKRQRETLYKRAREIPPTPLIFPPFPIIPSLNCREWRMKALASAKSAGHQSCIWLTPNSITKTILIYIIYLFSICKI